MGTVELDVLRVVEAGILGLPALWATSIEHTVIAPSKINRHSHGELSLGGTAVTVRIPTRDYYLLEQPYVFETVW